jgi:tRNA(Arg) A34 adenosine deaminase TadA
VCGAGAAQSGATLPSIVQLNERTKAGFLARARALRDQAVKEGDQAYGPSSSAMGSSSGRAGTTSCFKAIRPHAELLAVRDAARRRNKRDLSDCDVYSTATPCPMCQGALY